MTLFEPLYGRTNGWRLECPSSYSVTIMRAYLLTARSMLGNIGTTVLICGPSEVSPCKKVSSEDVKVKTDQINVMARQKLAS